jgi:hypothetical protein
VVVASLVWAFQACAYPQSAVIVGPPDAQVSVDPHIAGRMPRQVEAADVKPLLVRQFVQPGTNALVPFAMNSGDPPVLTSSATLNRAAILRITVR